MPKKTLINKFWEFMIYFFRYVPVFYPCRRFLYKMALKKCGKKLWVAEAVMVREPQNMEIGSNTSLNEFCYLHAKGGLKIGSNVRIAPAVKMFTFNHKFADRNTPIVDQGYETKPIEIGNDVWIGANAVILPGVKIGKGCVIGAGAVVSKDIPAYSIAVGVPAKVVKKR